MLSRTKKHKVKLRFRLKSMIWQHKLLVSAAVLSLTASSIMFAAGQASATQDDEHKVTICHRTKSVSNPYTQNSVNFDSATGELKDNGDGDHTSHTGPVWDANTTYPAPHNGDQWGDIIPPYTWDGGGHYDGLNWDAAGQAIWNNDCNPTTSTDTVTPLAPTATQPTCANTYMTVSHSDQEGVVWNYNQVTLKVGESVTFVASPAEGTEFTEGAQTSWSFTNDFDTSKCNQPPDVCPNIDGPQATVPPGLVYGTNGDCISPPEIIVCRTAPAQRTTVATGNGCVPPKKHHHNNGGALPHTGA
jgi:hypothetical protein